MSNSFDLLNEDIRKLAQERFGQPTPIQERAIPEILSGNNVLIIAPTGIGKTEAALLPVLHRFLKQKHRDGIGILYLTPLKSLNRDMLSRIEWWGEKLGLKAAVRHGDTAQSERQKQMKQPPQLLICTPETLGAILTAPKMGRHLENVRYVIIDEVHELVEDKRGAQLTLALERLAEKSPEFQRIGLSATVGEPDKVAAFFKLNSIVKMDIERKIELSVECPKLAKEDLELSEKLFLAPEVVARLRRLKELIDEYKSVLAFVNTRQTAELLSSRFAAWDKEHKIGVHHSSLSKDTRIIAEKKFKDGTIKGLIATSSLELGIDIGRIDLVVQYISPRQVSRLVQRVGRSGHSITTFPKGIIITTEPEDILESGVICKNALEGRLEKVRPFEKPYDVLAQQLVGLTLDKGVMKIEEAFNIVRRAPPYNSLTFDEFISVLTQLARQRILWLEKGEFGKRKTSFLYYYSNLSMIPDEAKYFVIDASTNKNVAVLDESFVVNNLEPRSIFITRGTPWMVLDISEKEVVVEPAEDISGAIPAWGGEQIPVPFDIAQEVAKLRKDIAEEKADLQKYCLDEQAADAVIKSVKAQEKFVIPDHKTLVFETIDSFVIMYAPFGSLVNETIGKILAILLSAYLGETVATKSDPYRIIFEFAQNPRIDLIEQFLLETKPDTVLSILEKSLLRTPLFRYKFIQVARRFGLLERRADYQRVSIRKVIEAVLDSPIYTETFNEILKEKFDLEKTKEILNEIQDKKIKFFEYKGKPSPMSVQVMQKLFSVPELISPARPEAEILDLIKKRIDDKMAKLICFYCSSIFYERIKALPEKIKCPKCGGSVITYAKSDEDLSKLFQKIGEGKKLTDNEKKQMKEYEQIASLVNAYGRKAVIVLSGHGIGPETATRILGRMRKTERELLKDMLDAQKTFIKTKRYWK
jgi:ATP-dependent Lhr-like helicase